ncbi:MAG: FliH/SctL family protein [Desulfobacteraceae bacterium]|nr:FliH/SctL family protein [Desulfobacteraceae bacterium]
MSSCRIIKGALRTEQPFAEFSFNTLQDRCPSEAGGAEGDFVPLFSIAPGQLPDSAPAEGSGQSPDGEIEAEGPGAEELQRLLQEACDRGFADGRREAEETFNAVCRTLSEAIVSVSGLREKIVRECEEDLLRLAVMVAKQVIRQEITLDRKILAQFVCEATNGIGDQNDIVIGFHPEDYRAVSANRHLYLAGVSDKKQITIKPDETVSLGGCVVETPTGLVDASVDAQLSVIFKRLLQERGHGCEEHLELPAEAEHYLAEQCGAEKHGYQQD